MILKIENLSISYGEKNIIDNISFSLGTNEIIGICGKNGCGKTSLCNAIADINEDNFIVSGKIFCDDKNIKDMDIAEKCQNIGIIFQESENQIFSPYVEDELAFAPENLLLTQKEIEKRINLAMQNCGIIDLRYKETAHLSGGEKQLVAIASVLTMQPKILIADEITSNLDQKNKVIIRNMLKNYSNNTGSVIFVTHNDEDKKICNRLINLSEGEK